MSNQPSVVALDIGLACPRREEIPASGSIDHKIDRKRSQLHSGTMISYEHSSDDYELNNHMEKKVNKTKLPRNHLHSWTTITSTPFNDGYQWRKYGEKKICNSKMPRCYYRCTFKDDQHCPATKQVQQKDSEDPPMFVVTYKQQHSCRNRNLPRSPQHVSVDSPPVTDPCHLRL
nr:WRKY transcription factor 6 [Crocus sativus]